MGISFMTGGDVGTKQVKLLKVGHSGLSLRYARV